MEIINYTEKRFLVVEDQRPFLVMLRGLLNTIGAQSVAVAPNAETALSLCRKEKFDFVVTDIHLGPDKKNGFELVEELRSCNLVKPTSVILVISADSTRELVLGSIEREPDDYLIKPFSQVQLKTRLTRAYHRRVELAPVFKQFAKGNFEEAIAECLNLLKGPLQYRQSCLKLLTDLYLRTEKGVEAIDLTKKIIAGRPMKWAQTYLGKAYLINQEYEKAEAIAAELISKNRFNAEAHDILAGSYQATGEDGSALASIKNAISIAPLSIKRQHLATQIARQSGDYVLAKDSCNSIWNMSKRSMHRDVSHLCNYVRSILDIVEHSDDAKQRNRFQQEALITLQRSRNDEVFSRTNDQFDFSLYENLVHSRINALDGKLMEAKTLLEKTQIAIEQRYPDFPPKMAPDSIKVMNDIGDFEDAEQLIKKFADSKEFDDPNINYLLNNQDTEQAARLKAYKKHNKEGIADYRDAKFENALRSFNEALQLAPTNIGVALNLLQCIVKVLEMQQKPDASLLSQCKDLHKLVTSIPLRKHHQQKWDELKPQVTPFMEKT